MQKDTSPLISHLLIFVFPPESSPLMCWTQNSFHKFQHFSSHSICNSICKSFDVFNLFQLKFFFSCLHSTSAISDILFLPPLYAIAYNNLNCLVLLSINRSISQQRIHRLLHVMSKFSLSHWIHRLLHVRIQTRLLISSQLLVHGYRTNAYSKLYASINMRKLSSIRSSRIHRLLHCSNKVCLY